MNRRMFRYRLETLRHALLWSNRNRSTQDRPPLAGIQGATPIGPPDPRASAPELLGNVARKEQRDALTTWEDEGGTTKPVTRR